MRRTCRSTPTPAWKASLPSTTTAIAPPGTSVPAIAICRCMYAVTWAKVASFASVWTAGSTWVPDESQPQSSAQRT